MLFFRTQWEDTTACLAYGLFQVPLSKNTQHQQKNHTKKPLTTKPQSSLFQQFQLSGVFVSASCMHRKAANDRKITALWAHTGFWGSLSVTGSTAPLCGHQHSWTAQWEVFCYHCITSRTHCRSASRAGTAAWQSWTCQAQCLKSSLQQLQ